MPKTTNNKYNQCIYETCGVYKKVNDKTVEISELPISVWTDNYRDFLET